MVISSLCIAPGVCFLWDIKAAVPRDRVTYKDASQLARQTLRLRDKWPWACLEFPSLVVCYLCWGWGNGDQVIADNCQGVRALQSSWYISASGYGCESMCALWVRVCVCVCARTFPRRPSITWAPEVFPKGTWAWSQGGFQSLLQIIPSNCVSWFLPPFTQKVPIHTTPNPFLPLTHLSLILGPFLQTNVGQGRKNWCCCSIPLCLSWWEYVGLADLLETLSGWWLSVCRVSLTSFWAWQCLALLATVPTPLRPPIPFGCIHLWDRSPEEESTIPTGSGSLKASWN